MLRQTMVDARAKMPHFHFKPESTQLALLQQASVVVGNTALTKYFPTRTSLLHDDPGKFGGLTFVHRIRGINYLVVPGVEACRRHHESFSFPVILDNGF